MPLYPPSGGADNRVAAGTQTGSTGTVVFSNANNVTFGMTNSSIVTASVTVQSSQGSIGVSAGAAANTISAVTFSNSNGLAFGLNAGTVTGSYTVPTVTNSSWTASDGATSLTIARLAFTNANGVTLTLSTTTGGSATLVGSHNALTSQSNQNVTANNGGFAFQTLSFSNANGISFGTSAGSAITGSHNAITTGRASTDGVGLATAQTNVTWTVNSAGLSLHAGGYAGTVTAATNATLTLNSAGLSISVAAPGGGGAAVSAFYNQLAPTLNGIGNSNSVVSIQRVLIQEDVAFSFIKNWASISVATQTNNSSAFVDLSISGVFYTRNGSTLSSVVSFSHTLTQTWSSNATNSVASMREITATIPGTTLTRGEYWFALHMSTTNTATGGANTTALANTFSMVANNVGGSASQRIALWGAGTAASRARDAGGGFISTGATRATIAFSDFTHTGATAVVAPVLFELRNNTWQ